MDLLKDWTLSVCITLIVASILSLLNPNGKMGRFYKIIISLFIFLSFIAPFIDTNFNVFNEFNYDNKIIENSSNNAMSELIRVQISKVLTDNKIENSSVIVNANKIDDKIEITNVSIAITDDYEINAVKNLVFKELGINAEVHKIGD